MSHALPTYLSEIELASGATTAPEWVQLIPAGPDVPSTDGRRRKLSHPQAVVDNFTHRGRPIPVDVEHATHRAAPHGRAAPAYGWVVEMEVRDGAIWGRVDWGEQAKAWITGKNYKYLSAGYRFDKSTSEITRITDMALVNNPGFAMSELADAADDEEETTTMDKAVLDALGLAETASAADAVLAIGKLKEQAETAAAAPPDPDKFVPKGQLDAANQKLKEHEAAETARADDAAVAAVEAAIADGKIAPATKDMMVEVAKAQGAEKFAAEVQGWPKVMPGTEALDKKETAKGKEHGLTEIELAVAKQAGMSPSEFAAAKKEEAE